MRSIGVKLLADVSGFVGGMRTATGVTRDLSGELGKASKAGRLDAVADQATRLGVVAAGAFGLVVKATMDFEKQMSAVSAATHANVRDMGMLRQAALNAGKDTKFSATQAAQGVEELAKAGVSTSAILGGGLKGALDLAAAGSLEVGEAAEAAASAMTQFKLRGADVPHVADLLAAGAGKAQGSVHQMSQALNQAGLVSAQMGLSVEDTVGTLTAFASAGLMGSDAGTSLKTALIMLANPTDKSKAAMQDLGLQVYNAQGQFVGITGLAEELRTKLSGLTQEQRNAALAQIFGSDAIRAASILYEQGATGIQTWINKTNDAGYAAETAAKKTDNLAGDIERLTGSLQTLAIESGSGANSGLRVLVKGVDALIDQFSSLPTAVGGTITVLAGLGGALLLGSAGWVKMRGATANALEELRGTGPAGEKAASGLQNVTKWAGRAAVAFAAYEVASAAIRVIQGDLNPQVDALGAGLDRWSKSGQLAGESARVLGKDMEDLKVGFKFLADSDSNRAGAVRWLQGSLEAIIPGLQGTNTSLTKTAERITAMDQALAQMVSGGSANEAAGVFARLTKELAVEGVSIDELKAKFPQYAAAIESAGAASVKGAGAVDAVGEAAKTAAQDVDKLNDAFNKLFNVQLTADELAIRNVESLKALTEELKNGAHSTNINTEEGRKNATAVLDRMRVINQMRESEMNQTGSVERANQVYSQNVDALRATMRQAGFTKEDIERLTGAYKNIPGRVNTNVSVTGTGDVVGRLDALYLYQRTLASGKPMADIRKNLSRDNADFLKFASGGRVPGYSPHKRADNIPSLMTAGEFVHPVDSVDYYGFGAMEAIRTKKIPAEDLQALAKFAGGGLVGRANQWWPTSWPFPVTAAMTKIPSYDDVRSVVAAHIPTSGATGPAMQAAIRQAFPGLGLISGYRPGSRTLSGALSYHALNRAVDYPPSRELAAYMYRNYKSRLKEEITPYQEYNVHNGSDHHYSGAVWNQHNFAGGNAHDHFAMARGGIITEPVIGVGASGRTYSFGEYGPETVVPGLPRYLPDASGGAATIVRNYYISAQVSPLTSPAEVGRAVVETIQQYESRSGKSWRN